MLRLTSVPAALRLQIDVAVCRQNELASAQRAVQALAISAGAAADTSLPVIVLACFVEAEAQVFLSAA